ncbi:MAG: hypothetical protein QM753_15205 [Thermomicrobiales bacterium]
MTETPFPVDVSDDVRTFLDTLDDPKRVGSEVLIAAMHRATGMPPALWPGNILGFGSYRYRYESGRTGESCALGFSPRAKEFSLYLSCYLDGGFDTRQDLVQRLGKVRVGKGCLYLKDPSAADPAALAALLHASLQSLATSPVVTSLTLGPGAQETTNV